jgi:hypothetical protein
MLITPEGIEMDVREQLAKAVTPILKIPEGRDTEVSAVQPMNEDDGILVTSGGMIIDVRELQKEKLSS